MTSVAERETIAATAAVPAEAFARIRRRMSLEFCKWDPQVGDAGTLAPFALVLHADAWAELKSCARQLAAETLAAEAELLHRPDLWSVLGVPTRMRRVLGRWRLEGLAPSAGRVMRFDFHPTAEGWRVSEVNSDVPGGYTEAWEFSTLMAAHMGEEWRPAGDPGGAWARAIARRSGDGLVALVCAPGYMEDRQIVAYLAKRLRDCGCTARMADLRELECRGRKTWLHGEPVEAVLRFYQAEWLAGLPRSWGWERLIVGGETAVTNAASAVLTESKGFPLVWDSLKTELPTWRAHLPETRPVNGSDWRISDGLVLKGKYGNNGDEVVMPGSADAPTLRRVSRELWWRPGKWVVQRRFVTRGIQTPLGEMFPCLGVYVVDGEVAGIYGRLSRGAVVDYAAMDVAVLVEGGTDDAG
ncbi:MAG: glutathionylspermidine synthase family protein [Phycisphaerae bacterium]